MLAHTSFLSPSPHSSKLWSRLFFIYSKTLQALIFCSFLPVSVFKMGQYFFFPLSAGLGCLGAWASVPNMILTAGWTQEKRAARHTERFPPCLPNPCPVKQCLLCARLIHAQIHTHGHKQTAKQFSKAHMSITSSLMCWGVAYKYVQSQNFNSHACFLSFWFWWK